MGSDLLATFLAQLPPELRGGYEQLDDLRGRLVALVQNARAAHPGVLLDELEFVAILAAALARDTTPAEALSAVHAADLFLAHGCAKGDREALVALDKQLGPDMDRAVLKSPTLGIAPAEFRQLLRERLFVSDGSRPVRIASYQGRGSLRSWIRVAATRLVVDLARKRHPEVGRPDDELARRLPSDDDPELDYLRHAYGAVLPAAFEAALSELTVRQRNLLRQRFLHELTVERLASMYDVHRSTLFDWLAHAREALLLNLRRHLDQRLPGEKLDSVLGVLGSRLELSVRRMLDSQLEQER